MARLPSRDDLSGPSNLVSKRAIASYDQSAIGRGTQQLGADVQDIGRDRLAKNNLADLAQSESMLDTQLLATRRQFNNDPDYSTFEQRAPAATNKIVEDAAKLIRDPTMRAKWTANARSAANRSNYAIFERGDKLREADQIVAVDDALETNRRIYVDPETSEAEKAKARADIEGTIKMGQETGLFNPIDADARRKKYIEDANVSRGKLEAEKNPDAFQRPLPKTSAGRASAAMGYFESRGWTKAQAAGIVGNLLAESSLNTGAKNPGDGADGSDSIGIAQWNGPRARALKQFAAENHVDWRDFQVQLAFVDHELRTTHKTHGDNLRAAQDVGAATDAVIMYEGPAGSQRGARYAHNYGGRQKFAAQAAGGEVNPDYFGELSPEEREAVYSAADTRRNQLSAEIRGGIETVVQNAPVAVQNTGGYDGDIPGRDDFMAAYGPQEGSDRFDNFQASLDVSQQAHDFRTMSSADIMAMVNEAQPTSSGDDAALETKKYETLSKAAEATIKAREADPAAYVQQTFPNVAQAWTTAQETGDFQPAMAATAAAQRQLGVQNMQLLPGEVAAQAVGKFKDENLPEQERFNTAASLYFSTADPQQRQAVFEQLVDAGLPDTTAGVFRAAERGDDGAAKRLMQAAMIDPAKLPGSLPSGFSPATIDDAVQTGIMDEGQIGDIFYGLSDGSVLNNLGAQRDAKLMNNYVNLEIRKGKSEDEAVQNVAKDLFGDVVPVTAPNAQILVPTNEDPTAVLAGLRRTMPGVQTALEAQVTMPSAVPAGGGQEAILMADRMNYVNQVMARGYFRNSGDGYVFVDPNTGLFVSDTKGEPIIFHPPVMTPTDVFQDRTPEPGAGPSLDADGNPVALKP